MGFVVVGGVEQALLVCALLRGDGGGDRAAQRVQALRRTPDKLAVAVAVKGIDVLKVDVQTVVVLLPDEGDDIIQKLCLHALIRQDRVGDVGREAGSLAEIRDGQQGGGLTGIGRLDEPFIRERAQLPLHGRTVGEGTEGGEIRQALRQDRLPHAGIDIGVDLDLLAHILPAAGDHEALPDHKARGVRDLVEALELLHRGPEPAGDGVETVPRLDCIKLHKRLLSVNRLKTLYSGGRLCLQYPVQCAIMRP